MISQVEHSDVGAYALGLLEEDDRRAFEEHLAGCEQCRRELAEFGGMGELLTGLEDYKDAATALDEPPGEVIDLLRRRRRTDRRGTYVIGAAAAAALIATGATVGAVLTGPETGDGHDRHSPAQALVVAGERHAATDARTGARGLVGLEGKGWGTHVGLELKGVKGPLRCHLEAVSRTGARSVVTGWQVPVKGYGVPGSPNPLVTHGGTAIQRKDLDRFEVKVEGGGTLLTIPV
ncbi:anti-sigma factor family protein [Actinomadura sp. 6N118]|uniref:anti-sigma factor family protein n=1 Tax=Actinomadura sp. 6N118 TaxID=3375151 RepID=UPI0037B004CC